MTGDPYLPEGVTQDMIDTHFESDKGDDIDPAQCRYRGKCRGCKEIKNDLSGDDGYCGDCN